MDEYAKLDLHIFMNMNFDIVCYQGSMFSFHFSLFNLSDENVTIVEEKQKQAVNRVPPVFEMCMQHEKKVLVLN